MNTEIDLQLQEVGRMARVVGAIFLEKLSLGRDICPEDFSRREKHLGQELGKLFDGAFRAVSKTDFQKISPSKQMALRILHAIKPLTGWGTDSFDPAFSMDVYSDLSAIGSGGECDRPSIEWAYRVCYILAGECQLACVVPAETPVPIAKRDVG